MEGMKIVVAVVVGGVALTVAGAVQKKKKKKSEINMLQFNIKTSYLEEMRQRRVQKGTTLCVEGAEELLPFSWGLSDTP